MKGHAVAPDRDAVAEAALKSTEVKAYLSAGRTGGEPEAAGDVKAYISRGAHGFPDALAHAPESTAGRDREERLRATAASQGERGEDHPDNEALRGVNAHASAAQPMGLERDLERVGYPHVLVSFVYDEKREFFTKRLGYSPVSWMGDSGAFTVWTKGGTVDLDDYIAWSRFYTELNPNFTVVSLDVLPGGPNRQPSAQERDRGIKQSLENGDRLRAAGLRIVEVYHLYEPLDFFEQLLARRQPGEIVGLGALASGAPANIKREFCDTSFAYLRDHFGWDNLPPVHGFGIAPTAKLGARYPWFSVDSSSWMAPAQFGHGIGRNGRKTGDDKRTSNRTVRTMYLTRVLERWNRQEIALTAMWERRGVRFAS